MGTIFGMRILWLSFFLWHLPAANIQDIYIKIQLPTYTFCVHIHMEILDDFRETHILSVKSM